jgi:glyoxylase-like metal-dependent hydrolase (beta-lactamase superfamily II)
VSAPGGIFTIDAGSYLERDVPLTVERLGDRLFTACAGDRGTVFVEGESSAIAVNTFGTPAAARAYRRAIEDALPGLALDTVVCTIDHLDHCGYAGVLAPEAEVVAHELCARVLASRGAIGQRPADRIVCGAGETLTLDGVAVHALYPRPSQGTGNLALHFAEQRALFVVGPRADARYGLLPDVHFRHLTNAWRELASLDVDVVIPGGGPMMDRAGLVRAADYLDALAEASQRAFAEGLPIWELEPMAAYASSALGERFGDLDGFDEHIGIAAIRSVHFYLMGGWGLEDTAEPERLMLDNAR